jgi:hypothetical protein
MNSLVFHKFDVFKYISIVIDIQMIPSLVNRDSSSWLFSSFPALAISPKSSGSFQWEAVSRECNLNHGMLITIGLSLHSFFLFYVHIIFFLPVWAS